MMFCPARPPLDLHVAVLPAFGPPLKRHHLGEALPWEPDYFSLLLFSLAFVTS